MVGAERLIYESLFCGATAKLRELLRPNLGFSKTYQEFFDT